jgi:hypothetical protein
MYSTPVRVIGVERNSGLIDFTATIAKYRKKMTYRSVTEFISSSEVSVSISNLLSVVFV